MGDRKPRLAFFIIPLCVLQGRFPWWGADALGESGSVHWITLETAEATPMPTAGAETGRHRPVYTRRPHRHGAGIARHPRVTRPATAGRRRAENTLYIGIVAAVLHIIAAWQAPFAAYGRPYRGNPGDSWAMGMLEVLSPLGNGFWAWLGRCLAVPLYLMPLIGSFPAMPYLGRAAGKALARGLGLCIVGAAPATPTGAAFAGRLPCLEAGDGAKGMRHACRAYYTQGSVPRWHKWKQKGFLI